jgi:hypothetical protein
MVVETKRYDDDDNDNDELFASLGPCIGDNIYITLTTPLFLLVMPVY